MDMFFIGLILGLIILVAIFYTLFRFFFRIMLFVTTALFILVVILGIFIIKDVNDLKNDLPTSKNLILLESDHKIIAGLVIENGTSNAKLIEDQTLKSIQSQTNYNNLLNEYYKVVVVESSFFDNMTGSQEVMGYKTTNEKLVQVMLSDNSYTAIQQEANLNSFQLAQFRMSFESDAKVKSTLFGMLLQEKLKSDPMTVINGIKDNQVQIKKETITIKMIRYMPLSFARSLVDKFVDAK